MKSWERTAVMFGITSVLIISGCSDKGEKEPAKQSNEPVTLKMYMLGKSFTDPEFEQLVRGPVQKKYPHIQIEIVVDQNDTGGSSLSKFIAAGVLPDLIYANTKNIGSYSSDLKAVRDLNGPIQQNRFNLDRFNPQALEMLRTYGKNGELYAIPFSVNASALYYNKDIFDRFAVPYPADGSTWEQILDLGKRVARVEGGIEYTPLRVEMTHISAQLSLPYVDEKTNKAVFVTDGWKNVAQLYKDVKELTNNKSYKSTVQDSFMKNQDLAMWPWYDNVILLLEGLQKSGVKLNWDIASHPNFKEKPGVGLLFDAKALMISSTTKHVKEALQVIETMTSDDVQLMVTQNGRVSSLKDANFKENYGKDLQSLQGKNKPALFKNVQAINPPVTKEAAAATSAISAAAKSIDAGTDINTALRMAEENANQAIAQLGQ